MKKINLTVLTTLLLLILNSCQENKNKNSLQSQKKETITIDLKDLIGNTYEWRYENMSYHIKIETDSTVFWKLVKGDYAGETEGTDKYIHTKLDKSKHFISWTEKSGLELYNILNFETKTLTTHGSQDGHMFTNLGEFNKVE